MLPDPTLRFTLPSIHDGTPLDCRIYHPSTLPARHAAPPRRDAAAILAHPYAPMGGSFDDPLVGLVGAQLLRRGFVLGTFNFRGAGRSAGRTSWTARPERDDYSSFVGFLVYYMHCLSFPPPDSTADDDDAGSLRPLSPPPVLLMGGYSYGALVTTLLPPLRDLLSRFSAPAAGSEAARIRLLAANLAAQQRGGPPHHEDEKPALTIPVPAYLLLSPLLGLVSHLATLSLFPPHQHAAAAESSKLAQHNTLAIFGDDDVFVPAGRLRAWAADLAARTGSRFRYREVASAGHFWSQDGVLDGLMGAVDRFAGEILGE